MWPLDLPLRNENLPPFTMLTFEFELRNNLLVERRASQVSNLRIPPYIGKFISYRLSFVSLQGPAP
jgi:hypothetical protein